MLYAAVLDNSFLFDASMPLLQRHAKEKRDTKRNRIVWMAIAIAEVELGVISVNER